MKSPRFEVSLRSIAAYTKLFASEPARDIADTALQIHGGCKDTRVFPLESYLSNVRIFRVRAGNSEIRRAVIARGLMA
ncbi:acyl-CoA dehydrogenase family protein [Leisingera thetidis]|uniref:acyl-CoA dehydrogenase family protein n=1 Tax=Leisingera thetidis TaxID=2930199 RepID=UPI0033142537